MNLRIKFNLVIMTCCAISFFIVFVNIKAKLNANMLLEIENKAHLILSISDKIDHNNQDNSYFTTNQVLSNFSQDQSEYSIAFSNAKSSDFQANIWQQQIIDSLISNTVNSQYSGIKSDEHGKFYILAEAINNSENQIIGAKFVAIYKQHYLGIVDQELNQVLLILIIIFIALFVIINFLIHILIIKPIKIIAQEADQISKGQTVIEELRVEGNDEISELSHSFNRIIRSLKAAMKLLND